MPGLSCRRQPDERGGCWPHLIPAIVGTCELSRYSRTSGAACAGARFELMSTHPTKWTLRWSTPAFAGSPAKLHQFGCSTYMNDSAPPIRLRTMNDNEQTSVCPVACGRLRYEPFL